MNLAKALTGCISEIGLQSRAELPGAAKPKLQFIQIQVHNRRGVQRHELAEN